MSSDPQFKAEHGVLFSTVDPEMDDVMAFLNVKSYNVADVPNPPMNGTPNPRQTVISEQSRKTGDFLDEELCHG